MTKKTVTTLVGSKSDLGLTIGNFSDLGLLFSN